MKLPFYGTKELNLKPDKIFNYFDQDFLSKIEYKIIKNELIAENLLEPKGVYGYFLCEKQGTWLVVYGEDKKELVRFDFGKTSKIFESIGDRICFFAVTAGAKIGAKEKELKDRGEYVQYFCYHGIAIRFAEAIAEYMSSYIAMELGLDNPCRRYSFGYPNCPCLSFQKDLFKLLSPERVGMELTERFMMAPEASVSAFVVL